MTNFYVYVHKDPRNNLTRYVGKGSKHRAWDFNKRTSYHKNWINELKTLGFKPIVEIIEKDKTEQESLELERQWISILKDVGMPLTNLTNGGDGCSGYKHTPEHRRYISKILKGRVKSEEHINNIKDGHQSKKDGYVHPWVGRKHSPESIEKFKKIKKTEEQIQKGVVTKLKNGSHKGEKNGMFDKPSPRRRPVKCLNNGKIYESVSQAAKELELFHNHIVIVCQGKNSHTKGWKFEYFQEAA